MTSVDVAKAEEWLLTLEPGSVDLVLTSPPYDGIRDYEGKPGIDVTVLGRGVSHALREGGVAAVVIQDQTKSGRKTLTSFRLAVDWVDNAGLGLFECCIYSRSGVPGAWWNRRFRVDHEYILIFVKGKKPTHFDKAHLMVPSKDAGKPIHGSKRTTKGSLVLHRQEGRLTAPMKCRGTVWPYASSSRERGTDWDLKRQHPATFPDKMARDVVLCLSPSDGLVVDPCVGSGTTLAVALEEGRRVAGCDIEEKYVALANLRLKRIQTRIILS